MAKSEVPDHIRRAHIARHKRARARGKSVPDLVYNGKTYFADNKGENWGGWRLRSRDSHKAQGGKRRAGLKSKTITIDQRESWYKRNFERIPGGMSARQAAIRDDELERKDTNRAYGSAKKQNKALEHLQPLAAHEKLGGFESAYNMDAADPKANLAKSDKVATPKTLLKQGVPLSRSSAIQKRANSTPAPDMNGVRFAAVAQDIKINQRPKAGQLNKKVAKHIAARAATRAGRYLPGQLGTAFDVIDSAQRVAQAAKPGANLLDKAQAGISVAATGLGATGVGDVIGMPLQILNDGIDAGRGLYGALTKQPSKASTRGRNLLRRRP